MRLIDADALLKEVDRIHKEHYENSNYQFIHDFFLAMFRKIRKQPTIDAVPVVRCKDCDWYREDGSICVNPKCGKSWYGCRVPEQHFCSYGERRSDD
jgi:hypothetical protein